MKVIHVFLNALIVPIHFVIFTHSLGDLNKEHNLLRCEKTSFQDFRQGKIQTSEQGNFANMAILEPDTQA